MSKKRTTPLARWLSDASPDQRDRLASIAGTSQNYIYQLAACMREPKVGLAFRIEDATREIGPFTVTAREMATMCALDGLEVSDQEI
ncbi:MAG: hypothetical protein ACK5OQ_16550 [Burkholderiales bacterium]|jgi:predicted transcriptional regulator